MSFRQVSLVTSMMHKEIGQHKTLVFQAMTDSKITSKGQISLIAKANGVPVRFIGYGPELIPSMRFESSGVILESKESRVAALFYSRNQIKVLSDGSYAQQRLGAIRSGLRQRVGTGDAASLIPGMVLGDTALQTPYFSEAMRRTGLTHLVAVSGANFAIVSSFLLYVMQFPIRRVRPRLFATALTLIAFIGLVRPSPSVLRAAAMAGVVIFAKSHNEKGDSIPSLGFAVGAVVLADPWQARDPGFALSVLATAGLLIFAPKLNLPKWLSEPIAATILTSPVIVGLSGYLSITSIFANVLAAPLVVPVTILGFISALLPPLAPLLIPIAKVPATLITKIAFNLAEFPVIHMQSAMILISIATAFLLLRKYWALLLIAILLLTYLQRWPNNDWQIANCDVGQGDALVLKVAPRQGLVIDTGPDPKLMDRCLKSLGINQIPLLILTHPHADHVGGLPGAMHNRKVGKVLSNTDVRQGEIIQLGVIRIEILWPDGAEHNFAEYGGEGSAINNQSIIALIRTPTYSILTTGDAEPEVQSLVAPYITKVDYLKVAHHGSRHQDGDFNSRANPDVAIISVGLGNKYGHPADSTVKLFRSVYRTDQDGAIAIDPRKNSVSSSKVGLFGLPVLWRIA